MDTQNRQISRIALALAAAIGLANVLYQAFSPTVLRGPEGVLAVGGALAPTLAILVAWWMPWRTLRMAMLVTAMLLELPALVIAGSALALAVELLLVTAVLATLAERPTRRPAPRKYSVVF